MTTKSKKIVDKTCLVNLTPEELKLIENHRQEKEIQIQQELKKKSLEEQFREIYALANKEISIRLRDAKNSLREAVEISEMHGVPFKSGVVDLEVERQYIPHTINQWKEVSEMLSDDFDIYLNTYSGGWEYWSISSLSC